MREITWKLVAGKEVPQRLDGTEVRYTLPEAPSEIPAALKLSGTLTFTGTEDEAKVLVSVFNEGFELNHRQKVAKRAASKEGSDLAKINSAVSEHKAGIRAAGTGEKRAPSKIREERQTVDQMLAELEKINPAAAAQYREKFTALRAKPAPKEGEATAAKPGATPAGGAPAAGAKKQK